MNKFLLLFVFALFGFVSCHKNSHHKFVITGTLPSPNYDGEWLYLVPAEGPHPRKVDSVQIMNSQFKFEGDKEQMSIVRTRLLLRFKVQELLVITEPGNIKIVLDSVSSAKGTPQNEVLQHWKENFEQYRHTGYNLNRELQKSSKAGSIQDSIRYASMLDSLNLQNQHFNYECLVEQGNNTFGDFIYRLLGVKSFSDEQNAVLDSIFNKNSNISKAEKEEG